MTNSKAVNDVQAQSFSVCLKPEEGAESSSRLMLCKCSKLPLILQNIYGVKDSLSQSTSISLSFNFKVNTFFGGAHSIGAGVKAGWGADRVTWAAASIAAYTRSFSEALAQQI